MCRHGRGLERAIIFNIIFTTFAAAAAIIVENVIAVYAGRLVGDRFCVVWGCGEG